MKNDHLIYVFLSSLQLLLTELGSFLLRILNLFIVEVLVSIGV